MYGLSRSLSVAVCKRDCGETKKSSESHNSKKFGGALALSLPSLSTLIRSKLRIVSIIEWTIPSINHFRSLHLQSTPATHISFVERSFFIAAAPGLCPLSTLQYRNGGLSCTRNWAPLRKATLPQPFFNTSLCSEIHKRYQIIIHYHISAGRTCNSWQFSANDYDTNGRHLLAPCRSRQSRSHERRTRRFTRRCTRTRESQDPPLHCQLWSATPCCPRCTTVDSRAEWRGDCSRRSPRWLASSWHGKAH